MKRLLFLVLIAFAISTVVPEEADVELEAFDWKAAWERVKGFLRDAKKWLQDNGLYDPIVNAIKTKGEEAAKKVCEKFNVPTNVCTSIVDWVVKNVF